MLYFEIVEGQAHNVFLRDGDVAAHVLIAPEPEARIIAAFPAGNSGAGLWGEPARLEPDGRARPVRDGDERGIEIDVRCDSPSLAVTRLALGSVRVLRQVDGGRPAPGDFAVELRVDRTSASAQRVSLDGAHRYALRLEVRGDAAIERAGDGFVVSGAAPLRFSLRATTTESPLRPLAGASLFAEGAGDDARSRDVLSFLSYEEKLCAGSWRFLTYFGRDTLLTSRLLMPALAPPAIEAGLGSVLERLSPDGRVAHEEDLGEWSLHRSGRAPSFDWTMIDDDFMLAPVLASWAIDDPRGAARFAGFLRRRSPTGQSYAELIAGNLGYVERAAIPFAERGGVDRLIRIDPRGRVGNWRDSQTGLGGGVYPWDVNAVLVPAALAAAARLYARYPQLGASAADLDGLERAWLGARELFAVEVSADELAAAAGRYADHCGLRRPGAPDGPVRFDALALRDDGSPVRVMHSDVGYALIFGRPDEQTLLAMIDLVSRPFPLGLATEIGVPVANPVIAEPDEAAGLSRDDYHGAVMWPWQHAMWILGLRAAARRRDLAGSTRAALGAAASAIEARTRAVSELRTAELWSWVARDGQMIAVPFGHAGGHRAESNAAQLWSAVELVLGR